MENADFFQVVALSEPLDHKLLRSKPTKDQIADAIVGKVLGWGVSTAKKSTSGMTCVPVPLIGSKFRYMTNTQALYRCGSAWPRGNGNESTFHLRYLGSAQTRGVASNPLFYGSYVSVAKWH